jgi:hypothetical protein
MHKAAHKHKETDRKARSCFIYRPNLFYHKVLNCDTFYQCSGSGYVRRHFLSKAEERNLNPNFGRYRAYLMYLKILVQALESGRALM